MRRYSNSVNSYILSEEDAEVKRSGFTEVKQKDLIKALDTLLKNTKEEKWCQFHMAENSLGYSIGYKEKNATKRCALGWMIILNISHLFTAGEKEWVTYINDQSGYKEVIRILKAAKDGFLEYGEDYKFGPYPERYLISETKGKFTASEEKCA